MEAIRKQFNDKKCQTCVHKMHLSGTHHLGCSKSLLTPGVVTALVQVSDHGFNNGWASWPFNFDSIWIDSCDSHLPEKIIPFESREEYMVEIQKLVMYLMNKMEFLKNKDIKNSILLGTKLSEILSEIKPEDSFENLQMAYQSLLEI